MNKEKALKYLGAAAISLPLFLGCGKAESEKGSINYSPPETDSISLATKVNCLQRSAPYPENKTLKIGQVVNIREVSMTVQSPTHFALKNPGYFIDQDIRVDESSIIIYFPDFTASIDISKENEKVNVMSLNAVYSCKNNI